MPDYSVHGYHLIPASEWVRYPEDVEASMRGIGGFPVNDAFIPIWNRPDTLKREFLILYGTYGSSKTTDRVQELIFECLTSKYFKCYYGRNIFDLAKKELHSLIVTNIKRLGLEQYFDFSEKSNGSKDIRCTINSNIFKPFGCDDEASIKGWDDPTHILVDELDQIEYSVFVMLFTRLRKKDARKCFIGCFNNCDVTEDHWIPAIFLNKEIEAVDERGNKIEKRIFEHFSLFTDNYFLDQEDYRNGLIEAYKHDPDRLNAVLTGQWGSKANTSPFYKNFRQNHHVGTADYDPTLCLHVSFDENSNPYLPFGIFQCRGNNIYCIDEIAAKNPNNTLRWVCSEIIRRYGPTGLDHQAGMIIYGDATSIKQDVKMEKGKDVFVLCKEYLTHFRPKLRVNRSNPNVAMRQNFINDILGSGIYGLNITISRKCKHMIADLINTAEAPDGNGKDKTKITVEGVRGVQRWGHFTDLMDYFICEAYSKYYGMFKSGGKKHTWIMQKRQAHNSF